MEPVMTHEEMVQELWDREKIRELTYEYGLAIEAQDAERMASLFTETGSVDFSSLGKGVIRGHDALKAFYTTTWPLKVKPFLRITSFGSPAIAPPEFARLKTAPRVAMKVLSVLVVYMTSMSK